MKPSRIVLLLVAIIAGGLAAFLATRGDRPATVVETTEVVVQEAKTQILVATAPIGVGQRLSSETVQWLDWPEGAVRDGYITVAAAPDALADVSGAVARFEIFPGDPIVEKKLVRSGQGYLSAVLPKGKRGVSINVSGVSASGGYIVPNDRVDVILTRPSETGEISETILQNVKVLAIGARLGETGTTGAPKDPDDPKSQIFDETIATLELDPVQSEVVVNGARIGELSLALRSIADFAENTKEPSRSSRHAVRMIRFGAATDVVAGAQTGQEAPDGAVEE